MSTVTQTIQTPLRGDALRSAVMGEVRALSGRQPFSTAQPNIQWAGSDRIVISRAGLVNGVVDIRDGSPSTVTATIELSGLAAPHTGTVRRELSAIAGRLQSQGAAATAGTSDRPARDRSQSAGIFAQLAAGFQRGVESVFAPEPQPAPDYGVPAPSPAAVRRDPGFIAKTTEWVSEGIEDVLPGPKGDPGGAPTTAPPDESPDEPPPEEEFPWLLVLGGGAAAIGLVYLVSKA